MCGKHGLQADGLLTVAGKSSSKTESAGLSARKARLNHSAEQDGSPPSRRKIQTKDGFGRADGGACRALKKKYWGTLTRVWVPPAPNTADSERGISSRAGPTRTRMAPDGSSGAREQSPCQQAFYDGGTLRVRLNEHNGWVPDFGLGIGRSWGPSLASI